LRLAAGERQGGSVAARASWALNEVGLPRAAADPRT
jgi:hypothetical protein